jgi:tripartite-type tricarboxylate transporter receptor subunit TctC
MFHKAFIALLMATLGAVVPNAASAQFYKGKTITMIVNYPAGGPTDLEGRIVAHHLPDFIPGHPNVIVKNVGGAGGLIGSNQLGEAVANGDTIGFFTLDVPSQILGNPALKTPYSNFVYIAGVESPLVVYMRRDTPPGIKVAADLMKTHGFKALSLNAENSNTLNMDLSLDLLGVKYEPIPAYRGLAEVQTAILGNIGQVANSSLSGWTGSIEPSMSNVVLPLWQLSPPKDGGYPRTKALPNMPTFEEFYASVHPDKKLSEQLAYRAMRAVNDPQLKMFRVAMMPPKTPENIAVTMRSAFTAMWKDPQFLADYSRAIKTEPILVTAQDGEAILTGLKDVPTDVKAFLAKYIADLTSK